MSDPMISTQALAAGLDEPSLRIIDATWFMPGSGRDVRAEYEAAHLPDAVFFDIDAIADTTSPLPHMLPTAKAFADAMARLGVLAGDRLVVYDRAGLAAPRVWWMCRAMGWNHVQVLDGGLDKWLAEGRPTTSEPTALPQAERAALEPANLVRDAGAVAEALASHGAQVVDARPAARFDGSAPEPRPGLRSGHMPGALNLPYSTLFAPDRTLLPAEGLFERLTAAGIDLHGAPVIATCGSGVTACGVALALARLGRWDAAVYDGSWAEWGSATDRAVAIGEA